jgi:GxxExxY protein
MPSSAQEATKDPAYDLAGRIVGCAMKVHSVLGFGFLESVYENALAHELRKAGLRVDQQRGIRVEYDGICVGHFVADLLVDDQVVVELKAVQELHVAHEVQLVNYLNGTGRDSGLLLNFGTRSLEFRRKYRRPRQAQG